MDALLEGDFGGRGSAGRASDITRQVEWKPLLEGDLGAAAVQTAREIADDLVALHENAEFRDRLTADLGGGRAGIALLFQYLTMAGRGSPAIEAFGEALLDDAVGDLPVTSGLYAGFTGVAWVSQHAAACDQRDCADAFDEVDTALLAVLEDPRRLPPYDLISGLAGMGAYAAAGLHRTKARQCLELIVSRLATAATHSAEGATWLSHPVGPSTSPQAASANLGVAHGVPGIIAVLATSIQAGVSAPTARELLVDAIRWLLSQPHERGFPDTVGPGEPAQPSRWGWCYGDVGIATVLLLSARRAGLREEEEAALRIARRAALRTREDAAVRDACLCHGTAGIAHCFNRLHQVTHDVLLREAAVRWYGEVLRLRRHDGIGGYATWRGTREHDAANYSYGWVDDPGFLVGAAGVGLALLAAATNVEPRWDQVLLLSAP